MKVSMIVALDAENGIGSDNKLIWHLPDDFKWFKQHTMGKPLLMGRNTMISLGKPLPKRTNLVLSSSIKDIPEGFIHVKSFEEALNIIPESTEELMIIGGGSVYKHLIDKADYLYITEIHHRFENMDTFFPEWNKSDFKEVFREQHSQDEKHAYAFDLCIYKRIFKTA